MKALTKYLSIAVTAGVLASTSAFAEEFIMGTQSEQGQQTDLKDCLVVAMNCDNQYDFSNRRSDVIRDESVRGADVTTGEEQKKMKMEREESLTTTDQFNLDGNYR